MLIKELKVKQEIIKGLEDMGFERLTPIQTEVMDPIMDGKDVIGQAHTGTGKTAAFSIPVINNIDLDINKPQCLILCPTRELAVQVKKEIKKITAHMNIKSTAVYGGAPVVDQIKKIRRGSHIIVGTPGRTIDLIRRRVISFNNIKTVILDEADEMLKMGFREDIETILENANEDIQTLFFSATIPKEVRNLKNKYQKNPIFIKTVTDEVTSSTINQSYYIVKHSKKIEALERILNIYSPKLALVFCNTKRMVDEVADQMMEKGYNCDKIHGDIKQSTRLDVLNKFNNGIINILIATDVAARGLDIKNVEAVINYDVPEKEDYYVHRVGRTGRAGSKGYSFTLSSYRDLERIQNIERYTKKEIRKRNIPTAERVLDVKKEKLVNSVVDYINNEDLTEADGLLEMLNKAEVNMEDAVKALIKMNYDFKVAAYEEDINDSFRKKSHNAKGMGKGKRKQSNPENYDRYYIQVGRKDKARESDILGAVAGECKISASEVGKIDVYETFSFFNVVKSERKNILSKMKNVKIKGRKVSAELTRKRK
ncbi:ATP-dependent RNA helicase DeaD [Dethiosulfatibacter aminovorans DSM 17477]|uniref:ATP-dependent RNA helicase DeaD n=1 Tax=Dethiosulfatibacter aminovorans DSM 17477 TaxID=1121476 RepID=A0A1M6CVU5_9FIRM|nr:DEAD/DEAH box helicase [Dethiosulfatibacter aminovorans]SHI65142.1 ATP-dependent RNA helicase DeaD [Dethiosulfatibacter aminovorans DSM 17477]